MKKLTNALPLILSFTVLLSFFSAVGFINVANAVSKADILYLETGAHPLKEEIKPKEKEKAETPKEEASSQSSSVAASTTTKDAVGKIHEQFLSPYSQQLNYNGIYIKNSTGLSVNIKNELNQTLSIKIKKTKEPEVLIVHTHATESYMSEDRAYYTASDKPRSDSDEKNVIKVGEVLATTLKKGGVSVLHDKTHHDSPSYNQSYSRAKSTINEYLKKYPSIKIVVDLHRDAIAMSGNDKCKPTKTINGKKAAQVMLVVGSETGTVTGFPNWKQNFRLALRFQQTMEVMYPGLARAMTFCSRKYNMNLTNGSMLLEVGTEANTLEEACYSAELAGNALLSVLNTLK
ncbi:MAG: stage II sporulation protein P [Clostridia bacterium]|nr:stage II sporulation protein P [Clostridia bacterium]